jgi:hypothetical protein
MEAKILHIFTAYGKTFTFRDVTIIHDNESVLVFRYGAMSDGNVKTASIIKSNIIGWSVYN